MAVADFCAEHLAAARFERLVEAEVTHDSGDQRVSLQATSLEVVDGGDGHDLVAIDEVSIFITEQDAVGVTIVRDANLGSAFADEFLDLLGVGAAAVGVDVGAVGVVVDDDKVGAEFAQDAGAGLVGRAVAAIERDAERLERVAAGKALLGEFDIAAEGVVDAKSLPDFRGGGADVFDLAAENQILDLRLDGVVEFVAIVAEEFDAVVLVGIVGGGEDNAGIGAQGSCDVGNTRGGQRADDEGIGAERGEAGDHGVLEHVAGEAGVLADDDFQAAGAGGEAGLRENMGSSAAELKGGLGGDGLDVGDASNAVGSE